MELNVSLSSYDHLVSTKDILFDMIRAAAAHDTGIKSVRDIESYSYEGMSNGKMKFIVAVKDDPVDEGGSASYVLSLMTFNLKGGLEVSEEFITVTSSKKLDKAMATAKPSDFE